MSKHLVHDGRTVASINAGPMRATLAEVATVKGAEIYYSPKHGYFLTTKVSRQSAEDRAFLAAMKQEGVNEHSH